MPSKRKENKHVSLDPQAGKAFGESFRKCIEAAGSSPEDVKRRCADDVGKFKEKVTLSQKMADDINAATPGLRKKRVSVTAALVKHQMGVIAALEALDVSALIEGRIGMPPDTQGDALPQDILFPSASFVALRSPRRVSDTVFDSIASSLLEAYLEKPEMSALHAELKKVEQHIQEMERAFPPVPRDSAFSLAWYELTRAHSMECTESLMADAQRSAELISRVKEGNPALADFLRQLDDLYALWQEALKPQARQKSTRYPTKFYRDEPYPTLPQAPALSPVAKEEKPSPVVEPVTPVTPSKFWAHHLKVFRKTYHLNDNKQVETAVDTLFRQKPPPEDFDAQARDALLALFIMAYEGAQLPGVVPPANVDALTGRHAFQGVQAALKKCDGEALRGIYDGYILSDAPRLPLLVAATCDQQKLEETLRTLSQLPGVKNPASLKDELDILSMQCDMLLYDERCIRSPGQGVAA